MLLPGCQLVARWASRTICHQHHYYENTTAATTTGKAQKNNQIFIIFIEFFLDKGYREPLLNSCAIWSHF